MQFKWITVFSILAFALGIPVKADAELKKYIVEEVQFTLPQGWSLKRNPEPGIKIKAENGDRLFLYQGKFPNNFSLMGDTAKGNEAAINEFAIVARRSLERTYGLDLLLKERDVLKINGLEAINIVFEFSNSGEKNGFVRMILLLTPKVAYGFIAISAAGNGPEEKSLLNQIFQSITIDPDKATGVDPMNERQMLQLVKETLLPALNGMPHGWTWTLKKLDIKDEGKMKIMEAVVSLNRSDTLTLLNCLEEVFEIMRIKGRAPHSNEMLCKARSELVQFFKQFGMIAGVFMSQLVGSKSTGIQYASLTITDAKGTKGRTARFKISRFLECMKTQDGVAFAKAIEWR